MRKIYLKILIGIIIALWIIYFIQSFSKVESFTPRINSMYRPYIRRFNQHYENFMNKYNKDVILNKLKKWNIY
jgi:hypothetical protein